MKKLNQFITEYIVKKKLDKFIDSEHDYKYFPKSKEELIENIEELLKNDIYDFNCIDVSNITDMSNLFNNDIFYNISFDVSDWDVSNVTNMRNMFKECEFFNCDLSKWDVRNVKRMILMFQDCEKFEGKGLENWNVSNVINMRDMFDGCTLIKNKPSWYKE